jgi:hypothetical protein
MIIAPFSNERSFFMIKKVKEGYRVVSEKSGRNLGTYKSKDEAKERLRQVEFFKHKGAKSKSK